MPVTRHVPRLSPLAAVLLGLCSGVQAQTLPRRDNVETALHGRVDHDLRRNRHVLSLEAGTSAVLPADGGALADIELLDGAMPSAWSSDGGALFVRRALQPIGDRQVVFDTGAEGPRWLRLDAGAQDSRAIVHVRTEGAHGGEDPWRVALRPREARLARDFPESIDHVVAFGNDGTRTFDVRGQRHLRLDLWRTQVPRLLPSDASWLHVEADGRVVYDGRPPTPALREQMAATDQCDHVLDLAGRVRIDLPDDARELTVRGEPGTWLKVLAPLPGSPPDALPIASDPGLERVVQRDGEPLETAFNRALSRLPSVESDRFLARFSYFRDVAVRPAAPGSVDTRLWRARFPDRTERRNGATNRPADGASTIDATTFHWLPAGTTWHVDVPDAHAPALLRVSVAHADADPQPVRLRLQQAGRHIDDIELDPRVVQALRASSAEADTLLAVDPAGESIVDASRAQLLIADAREPVQLANTGTQGAWIAVERRVLAHRRLADAALATSVLPVERLRAALLAAPTSSAIEQFDEPAATRAITTARHLLLARAAVFGDDTCVSGVTPDRDGLAQAQTTFAAAFPSDPVLARCAALRAAAIAPRDSASIASLQTWSAAQQRPDLMTGFLAWALRRDGGVDDASTWQRLATSLDAEDESTAAALARRAAGVDPGVAADALTTLAATRSAGHVRLNTTRQSEVAYALAGATPATWVFATPGDYRLELRRFSAGSGPQWITLRSGATTWRTALPAVDASRTDLRDVASGAAPGPSVLIAFHVPQAGVTLDIEGDAPLIARIESTQPLPRRDALAPTRRVDVDARAADQCRVQFITAQLPIVEPGAPVTASRIDASIQPVADAAVLSVRPDAPPTDPTPLALDALWRLQRGDDTGAAIAASRALFLREQSPSRGGPAFDLLDDRVTWARVEAATDSGRVLRALADGYPVSPVAVLRQRLAGVSAAERFVIRPDQAWVLDGLAPFQRVGLAFEQRAALPNARVEVGLTGGSQRALGNGERWTVTDTADAAGALRLRVGPALPGTFLALDVLDEQGIPLDATHGVAYARTPVSVRLDRPSLLRITEWAGTRSTVRTQWVATAGITTITAQALPGAAVRISRLVITDARPSVPTATTAVIAAAASTSAPTSTTTLTATSTSTYDYVPAATQASTWPNAWPDSGGEDRTWGFIGARRQRIDSDDPGSELERFSEVAWRTRYRFGDRPVWGRAEVTLRRPDIGATVFGVEHALEWRQADGPWGATLDTSAWTQRIGAPLSRRAYSFNARAAALWERGRDDRWRDRWEFGIATRQLSLDNLTRAQTAAIDNDVYSRYRDTHRNQLDASYALTWRARYDTEWVLSGRAVTRASDPTDIDNAGATLGWRWARNGWMASAKYDARRYFASDSRTRAFDRERVDADVSRLFLSNDDGWRVRLQLGRDLSGSGTFGGLSIEWFDHDGRGLRDFAPSELFLRGVTETDLINPLIPSDPAP